MIESLASNEQRLKQLIGRAACAADILNELAQDVRLSDFNEIVREQPRLRPFNNAEKTAIDNIDRNAPIA